KEGGGVSRLMVGRVDSYPILLRHVEAEAVVDPQAVIPDVEVPVVVHGNRPPIPGVIDLVGRAFRPEMRFLRSRDRYRPAQQRRADQVAFSVKGSDQIVVVEYHRRPGLSLSGDSAADENTARIPTPIRGVQETFSSAFDDEEL